FSDMGSRQKTEDEHAGSQGRNEGYGRQAGSERPHSATAAGNGQPQDDGGSAGGRCGDHQPHALFRSAQVRSGDNGHAHSPGQGGGQHGNENSGNCPSP